MVRERETIIDVQHKGKRIIVTLLDDGEFTIHVDGINTNVMRPEDYSAIEVIRWLGNALEDNS